MKLNLKLGTPRPLSRAEAWGCFTANLAVPGSGSLAAGRTVGYYQMAVYFTGFIMTLVCGIGFIRWLMANSAKMKQTQDEDPVGTLLSMWTAGRWALLGIAIFIFSMIWSIITSWQIMQSQRKNSIPPRII